MSIVWYDQVFATRFANTAPRLPRLRRALIEAIIPADPTTKIPGLILRPALTKTRSHSKLLSVWHDVCLHDGELVYLRRTPL